MKPPKSAGKIILTINIDSRAYLGVVLKRVKATKIVAQSWLRHWYRPIKMLACLWRDGERRHLISLMAWNEMPRRQTIVDGRLSQYHTSHREIKPADKVNLLKSEISESRGLRVVWEPLCRASHNDSASASAVCMSISSLCYRDGLINCVNEAKAHSEERAH